MTPRPRFHPLSCLLAVSLLLAGCGDAKVTAYHVSKESAPAPTNATLPAAHPSIATASPAATTSPAASPMTGTPVATAAGASLTWSAPAHWQAKAGSAMRKGTYVVTGDGGTTAELAITAFPGDVGGEVANVNRWRGQLQLAPLAERDVAGAVTRLSANGLAITVLDLTNPSLTPPAHMIGAMVPYDGATWFFKLTGSDALVAREKSAFLEFVQSIKPAAAARATP